MAKLLKCPGAEYANLKIDNTLERMKGHWLLDDNRQKNIEETFKLRDEGIKVALASVDQRLAQMNEFRAQLNDQAKSFLTRTEYDTNHRNLIDKIDGLTVRVAASEGSSIGSEVTKSYVFQVVGVALTIVTIIIYIISNKLIR